MRASRAAKRLIQKLTAYAYARQEQAPRVLELYHDRALASRAGTLGLCQDVSGVTPGSYR